MDDDPIRVNIPVWWVMVGLTLFALIVGAAIDSEATVVMGICGAIITTGLHAADGPPNDKRYD